MTHRIARAICALGFLTASPLSATAMTITERFQLRENTSTNLNTFAGAMTHTEVRQRNVPAFSGEVIQRGHALNNASPQNIAWVGDAHIKVEIVDISGATDVTARFTSIDGLPGISTLSWDIARTPTIEDGHYVFRRTGVGGTGGVANGFPYTERITFLGDWSSVGTTPGSHVLEEVNPLWTIDQNFVFDGTKTVFQAHIDEFFNDGLHGLGLTFSLHGAPIPEPSTHALFVVGLGLVGYSVRRSRRAR